jgi:prevent-host-death family protein
MATRIVTASELKVRLGALIAELDEQGVPLCITRCGKPTAVIARYEEYEALLRKIEYLEDMLTMRESLAAPGRGAISLEKYECQRATRARG